VALVRRWCWVVAARRHVWGRGVWSGHNRRAVREEKGGILGGWWAIGGKMFLIVEVHALE